jgi:hypothetical protein
MTLGCSYNARKTALRVVCACAAWPNGVGVQRGAERDHAARSAVPCAASGCQKRSDSAAPLERLVGRDAGGARRRWCATEDTALGCVWPYGHARRRSWAAIHPADRDHGRRAPNGLAFSCRRGAPPITFKMPTISRAEGGQLQRRVSLP